MPARAATSEVVARIPSSKNTSRATSSRRSLEMTGGRPRDRPLASFAGLSDTSLRGEAGAD